MLMLANLGTATLVNVTKSTMSQAVFSTIQTTHMLQFHENGHQ